MLEQGILGILQGEYKGILQGAKVFYRKQRYFTGSKGILQGAKVFYREQRYFTGSIPLLTPNHSVKICGGPEAQPPPLCLRNVV